MSSSVAFVSEKTALFFMEVTAMQCNAIIIFYLVYFFLNGFFFGKRKENYDFDE